MNLGSVGTLLKAKPHSYIYIQVTEHWFNTFVIYMYTLAILYLIHLKWTFGWCGGRSPLWLLQNIFLYSVELFSHHFFQLEH